MAVTNTGYIYWSGGGKLYRRLLADTTSCELVCTCPFGPGIVADNEGNIYNGGPLTKYDAQNDTVIMLGNLPPHVSSLGDIFFYEGTLYVITNYNIVNFTDIQIWKVNIADPSQSCYFMSLPSPPFNRIFGAFSINYPGYSKAYVTNTNFVNSVDTADIYELDMTNGTVGNVVCRVPSSANGATSIYSFPSVNLNPCSIVPVNLLNFSYALSLLAVKLQWETNNEISNSYFIIERSTDAIKYDSIGKVKAQTWKFSHNQSLFFLRSTSGYFKLLQVKTGGPGWTFPLFKNFKRKN